MDIIDGSGLWTTGSGQAPPPPPPPAPSDDGVILVGSSAYAERLDRLRQTDPWADLRSWWKRLRRLDAKWLTPDQRAAIERDDQEIMDLTRLTRRQ